MAFKIPPQSLILRSIPTSSSAALAADLLNWASQHHQTSTNSSNNNRSQLVRSSVIPGYTALISKISNWRYSSSSSSSSSSSILPSYLIKNHHSVRFQSSNSTTFISNDTIGTEPSSFLLENTIQYIKTVLNQSQKGYTKSDIEQLCQLVASLCSAPSSLEISEFIEFNRRQIQQILLTYKRYDTLLNFMSVRNGNNHFSKWCLEDLGIVIKVALLKPSSIKNPIISMDISELISHLTLSQLKSLTQEITHYFTEVHKRPIRAFEFWIHAVRIIHPDMKIANHSHSTLFMKLLTTILNKCTVVNDIFSASEKLVSEIDHRRNLNLTLSFAYLRNEKDKSNVDLWLLSEKYAKNGDRQWANAIKSYINLGQFDMGYKLWLEGIEDVTESVSSVALKAICESFDMIQNMNQISKETLHDVLHTGRIPNWFVKKLIFRYIKHGKGTITGSIMPAYDLYQTHISGKSILTQKPQEESIEMVNVFLEHANRNTSEYDVFQAKVSELGPNDQSFHIYLKDLVKEGDLSSASKLVEVLEQHEKAKVLLRVDHYTELINLLISYKSDNQEVVDEVLRNIRRGMKSLQIKPDHRFVKRLISLKYRLGNYAHVRSLYYRFINEDVLTSDTGFYGTVLKSMFRLKDFDGAKKVWDSFETLSSKNDNGKDSDYYVTKLIYLSEMGELNQIRLIIDQIMPADRIVINSKHYHSLLSAFNKKKLYVEVVEEYSKIPSHLTTSTLYRDLLIALVRLEIINRGNFDKPQAIAKSLLKSGDKSKFNFKTIKPLITSLRKYHQQDKALELIVDFEKSRAENVAIDTLNILKQKLLIFSKSQSQSSQNTFKVLFVQYQDLMRSIISQQGKAPPSLKQAYIPLIKPLIHHHKIQKSLSEFASMFSDLVFIHGFTFNSRTYNYAVRHLVKNKQTFRVGLSLIERKLIGGYLGNVNQRLRLKSHRRRVGPKGEISRQGKPPYIAWGVITREENVNMIYNYILRIIRSSDQISAIDIIERDLTKNYPKLMKNIERKLIKRFEARNRALLRKEKQLASLNLKEIS